MLTVLFSPHLVISALVLELYGTASKICEGDLGTSVYIAAGFLSDLRIWQVLP